MDPAPLRESLSRWRHIVEVTHEVAEGLADTACKKHVESAAARLEDAIARRERDLARQLNRDLARLPARSGDRKTLKESHDQAMVDLEAEQHRVAVAIGETRPRLITGVAARLMRSKHVSA